MSQVLKLFKQQLEAEEELKLKRDQLIEGEIVALNKNLSELNKILDEEKS